jgi:AcrR family transcriptional regulator
VPKVTEAYRLQRRELILTAAARCFARDGFGVSMDDVIAEAGLSAGAVYGYFRGKDELIRAAAERAMDLVAAALPEVVRAPTPAVMLAQLLTFIEGLHDRLGFDPTRVAVQAWGEAARNPAVHAVLSEGYGELRGRLADVVRRWQAEGAVRADADPLDVAKVLFGLVPGFIVQRQVFGDVRPDAYAAALAALAPG